MVLKMTVTQKKINPWYNTKIPEGMPQDPIVLRLLKLYWLTDEEYQILKESFGRFYTSDEYVMEGMR